MVVRSLWFVDIVRLPVPVAIATSLTPVLVTKARIRPRDEQLHAHLDAQLTDSLQTLNRSLWAWIEGE